MQELDPMLLQLHSERVGVDRLDEARAQRTMDVDRRADDLVRKFFMCE